MTTETKKRLVASALAFFLIRDFEKFVDHPYHDGVGKMTIGYGHLIKEGEVFPSKMTKNEAEALLHKDVDEHQNIVYRNVKVYLTQAQHDALVCFVYNIGEATFKKSGMLRELNSGNYDGALDRLGKYINGHDAHGNLVPQRGLIARRKAETDLWNGEYTTDKKYK
jgi:lysozyme